MTQNPHEIIQQQIRNIQLQLRARPHQLRFLDPNLSDKLQHAYLHRDITTLQIDLRRSFRISTSTRILNALNHHLHQLFPDGQPLQPFPTHNINHHIAEFITTVQRYHKYLKLDAQNGIIRFTQNGTSPTNHPTTIDSVTK
jgi:hypothetical protein